MTSNALKALAVFGIGMAIIQIFMEDLLMYLAISGRGGAALQNSPILLIAIPFAFSLLLFGVLFLAAVRSWRPP